MGLLDSVKGFLGMDDDLYDEEDYEYEGDEAPSSDDVDEEKPRVTRRPHFSRTRDTDAPTYEEKKRSISVIQTVKFDDAAKIADIVKDGYPVIFDVSAVEYEEDATKIVDFMSGAVYGLDGDIKRISGGIFIAVPNNMGISSDQIKRNLDGGKFNF